MKKNTSRMGGDRRYLEIFSVQIGQLDGQLKRLHEYSAADFLTWCGQTETCYKKITSLPRDPNFSFTVKKKIISSFKENLTKVILNLQFHDIIAQKIQRVQGILDDVFQDTVLLAESGRLNEKYDYFALFPKLAALNIGLLQYINLEYRRSTSEVEKVVNELKENKIVAKRIGLDSFDTDSHARAFECTCVNLATSLEKSSRFWLEQFASEVENVGDVELQDIRQLFSMESERVIFDSIFKGAKGIDLLYSDVDNGMEDYAQGEVELF